MTKKFYELTRGDKAIHGDEILTFDKVDGAYGTIQKLCATFPSNFGICGGFLTLSKLIFPVPATI